MRVSDTELVEARTFAQRLIHIIESGEAVEKLTIEAQVVHDYASVLLDLIDARRRITELESELALLWGG